MTKSITTLLLLILVSPICRGGEDTTIKAFGLTLGEKVDVNSLKKVKSVSHAGDEYEFTPLKPYGVFSSYVVRVTPKSNIAFQITASAEVSDLKTCKSEFAAVSNALNKKYGKGKENLSSSIAGISQLRYKAKNGRIVVQCMTLAGYEVSVNYISDIVEKLATQERGQLMAAQRDSSSL